MPLLHKRSFVRARPPQLSPNDELFYCKFTNEVFEDYEQFFQRVILCNSLVWTCEITGRPGLTFQEAVDSEKRAYKVLGEFPQSLKKPTLYLATRTKRNRLSELCDDVFSYARDRYFVGEKVEYTVTPGFRKQGIVVKVFSPESTNGSVMTDDSSNSDVEESTQKVKTESNIKSEPDPNSYHYEIENVETFEHVTLKAGLLGRVKGSYSREKNKLYLKHATQPNDGFWVVKEKFVNRYSLSSVKFEEIFCGDPPAFKMSSRKRIAPPAQKTTSTKTVKHRPVEESLEAQNQNVKRKYRMTEEEREIRKEELKKKQEEEKRKKKEEKVKERERKQEERQIMVQYMMEWNRPRDDLLCEDLKDLPSPIKISCSIPDECIGDFLMILEFLHVFGDILDLNDHFPEGVEIEILLKALTKNEVDGPLKDLFQFLLDTIFTLQENISDSEGIKFEDKLADYSVNLEDNVSTVKAIEQATIAAKWSHLYHGAPVKKLSVDAFTVTEVLRIHLMSSGSISRSLDACPLSEDPGLLYKMQHPEILDELAISNIYDLSVYKKISLLLVLIHQIMSHGVIRDYIEEAMADVRLTKTELRQVQYEEYKRDRDFSARYKFLSDARAVEKVKAAERAVNGNDAAAESENETVLNEEMNEEVESVKKMNDEQWEEFCDKLVRDETKKKELFFKQERILLEKCATEQRMGSISPVGYDRAFRRYWAFASIPGLFVEDSDSLHKGKCLSTPTPYNPDMNPAVGSMDLPLSSMRKYLQKASDDRSINSDKENEDGENCKDEKMVKKSAKPASEIKLSEKNGCSDGGLCKNDDDIKTNDIVGDDNEELKLSDQVISTPVFGMCTADPTRCPVHSETFPRVKWGLFAAPEIIDKLISNLNVRGHRERDLIENLKSEKLSLFDNLISCPLSLLCDNENHSDDTMNSSDEKLCHSERALQTNLRDTILDLEEKIYHGSLGQLKVNDRLAWRESISNGKYEMQCSSLEWGGKSISSLQEICVDSTNSFSRQINCSKELSGAVLQLAQGLDPKYLNPPLGEDMETKKNKIAEYLMKKLENKSEEVKSENLDSTPASQAESEASTPHQRRSALDRWCDSLMSCSCASQVFLHVSTFERSVEWSRSVLNAKCKICRRKGDAEQMLLCDNCDRGHHLYCLKPPLKNVPVGHWFCPMCRPKDKSRRRRKPNPKYTEESDELSDDLEIPSKKSVKGGSDSIQDDDKCDSDDKNFSQSDDEYDKSEYAEDYVCQVCEKGGTVICCDNCPLLFHLDCLNPPLKRVPRGQWYCPNCTPKQVKVENKKENNVPRKVGRPRKRGRPKRNSDTKDDDVISPKPKRPRKHYDISVDVRNHTKSQSYDLEDLRPARRISSSSRRSVDENSVFNFKICNDLLTELTKHDDGWLFLRPVSKKDAPDYHSIIKRPMDFGKMRGKLNNLQYKDNKEFLADAHLIFQNCELYNPNDSAEFKSGRRIYKFFESRMKQLGLMSDNDTSNEIPSSKRSRR